MPTLVRWAGAFLAGGLLGACHHAAPERPTPVETGNPSVDHPAVAVPATPQTDADIAAIFLAANYTDISYAKLVTPERTQNAAIRDFAKQMLTDHTRLNREGDDYFASLNITPQDNTTSLDFRDESAAKRDTMRDLDGRAFDSTYITNEIRYHTKLLETIDRVLIPDARNMRLRLFFVNVRPAVAGHLGHAQDVKTSLGISGH